MKAFLYYLPRVLSVMIIMFFLVMSFDEPIISIGFLMHNIPTIIITFIAVLAWKNNLVSAITFLLLAITTFIFFKTYREPMTFLIVTTPFLLVSAVAFVNYFTKNVRPKN